MSNHEFTLVIDHQLDGEELDRLFEAGGDDSAPELQDGQTSLHFDRDAATLAEAVASALFTVTVAGLTVIAIQAPDVAAA
jgi:hypothetical protein